MGRLILLAFLVSAVWIDARAQRSVERFSHPELNSINELVASRSYRQAIDRSLAGAKKLLRQQNWEGYISLMLRAAEIETFEVWKAKGFPETTITEDYRRPLSYLNEMYRIAGGYISRYPYLQANAQFTQAVVYDWLNLPDTAEQMHLSALNARREIFGSESREVADSYLWLGQLYNWGLQRKELAEKYYRLAVSLQQKFLPESRYALGSAYYGLAIIARKNFQFDEVATNANLYLSLYDDLPYEQAFAYEIVANMYSDQGNYEQCLRMREKSLEIYEASGFKAHLIEGYGNLSSDLRILGRYVESRKAIEKCLKILGDTEQGNPHYEKLLYENLGDLYRSMGRYDSSEYFFNQAVNSTESMFGDKGDELAGVYDLRGRLFMDKGEYSKALADFHRMLVAVLPSASALTATEAAPISEESPYFFSIISAYFNKGDALAQWYRQTGDSAHLLDALNNYRTAYDQTIIARQSIGDDLSKPFLLSNFSGSINRSIQCARLLYRHTGKREFFDDILRFAEFTKYLNVLEARERADRANNSGIPKALLFELEEVRNELNLRQRSTFASSTMSSDSARKENEELASLINRRRDLMTRISGYPGYTQSAVDDLLINLDEIQSRLAGDEQLLEYVWGKDSIYVLSITAREAGISTVFHTALVDTLISSVYRAISGDPSYSEDAAIKYSENSSALYETFFKPFAKKERLIVVPDGPLSLIPVEALATSPETRAHISFRELQYMIYDHEISYTYSSSIYFRQRATRRGEIEKVLAFSYSGASADNYVARRNEFSELPGTYLELETLSRLYDRVASFTDRSASKRNFVGNTAGYDLIHLGVHGVGDEDVADNSHLVFKGDARSDSVLYAYEIYNLKLDAGLIVLSACETGIGRNQAGEGVLSIARAFTYAGCPSVVMSLWDVPDIFTSTIMTRFYENLNEGYSVSASLRNSKLRFLDESDVFTSHPANWAAFVANGQNLAFKKNSGEYYWLLIAVPLVALSVVGARKWYRRRHSGNFA